MNERQGAFFKGGVDGTPKAAAAIVLLALGGLILLRKLHVSVSAGV